MPRALSRKLYRVVLQLLGLWLAFDVISRLAAEFFWFGEIGYLSTWGTRLATQIGLWIFSFLITLIFLLFNLRVAKNAKSLSRNPSFVSKRFLPRRWKKAKPEIFTTSKYGFTLRLLLPVVIVLSLLAGIIVVYYGQEALRVWYPQIQLPSFTLQLTTTWKLVLQLFDLQDIFVPILQLILLLGLTIAILIYPHYYLKITSFLISSFIGFIVSANWNKILEYFNATNFGRTDNLFSRDISFYVFSLPIWELLDFCFIGALSYSLVAVTLTYLRSADAISEGRFAGFSLLQRLHINALVSLFMLGIALRYWLLRYKLLYSNRGINYGASYTDITVELPIYTGLSIFAIVMSIYLVWRIILLFRVSQINPESVPHARQLVYAIGLFLIVATISSKVLPAVVQQFIVKPNELVRERPFIRRTIELTRKAFNLDSIEVKTFDPQGKLTLKDLQENDLTISNIRLWDTRPLLQTNRQLQQIRPYYKFPDADIDRYTLTKEKGTGSEKQQTIIAAREMDYSGVPQQAKTWVNEHLFYTHGYGFTLSPVNEVIPGGLPKYYVKDIGVENKGKGTPSSLQIAKRIRASIPIGQPRIYYGEIADTYVMTGTKTQEFDYPKGNENAYNVYDGRGGIPIGSMWRRLLFAQYLKDWQMLFTRSFKPETKLLFRRNIKERVKAIAPFLHYDKNPYLVVADGNATNKKGEGTYLYWVLDAYTVSDRYPYSDPGQNDFNYIRNSVKVIIDAYNGTVDFYIADDTDPIINTFKAIFPNLLKPLSSMPVPLKAHLRYPVDLFSIQSERLLEYHMTQEQVFYNREDLWKIPKEVYGTEARPVKPYYLIMKLPTAKNEEFILMQPFTPTQRENLIAWLAARSDGRQYGKLLLYEFPKQKLVYGQKQIEALINQNPEISRQITLWNREGSRAIQGNLLVIPIEESLLYVEPLYLEAEKNSLPTLIRVIIFYQNKIVMEESLEKAIEKIFDPESNTTDLKENIIPPINIAIPTIDGAGPE
ncbi:UPF0182 family protein [Mastigocoleus testarum]|uniref:UPF0182 protein BC008_37265 n=1 Tax=Mastigocoleus testarum BC008 TaxID=371196 RepID=A0A0V7ZC64_9CYAN|nr:UPF0182 family protein [Mastigocoleus testarum]KST62103.1 hypothetical protein BC008_37265 [Mastigocoleus testarum BC008]